MSGRKSYLVTAALAMWLVGCPGPAMSTDGGPPSDGGADGAVGPSALAAPMPPASPETVARPCADAWTESDVGCVPFESEPTCSGARAALVGEPGCVEVGNPCPVGAFADPPTTGEVIYVSASATTVGDGSAAAPYDRLWRAIARASSGTTILLSKGEHVGDAVVPGGVHVRGACAAETTLRTDTPRADFPTLLADAGSIEISDLTLDGDRPGVFAVGASARATLFGVVIEDAVGLGLLAQGGTIDAEEVVIRGTRAVSGMAGRGADAIRDGTLTLRRSLIEGTEGGGTLLSSGARATIADVLYRDIGGRAISAQEGAMADVDRVAILRARDVALNGNNAGTTLTVDDLLIDGVSGAAGIGRAISVSEGATLDASGVALVRVEENALFVTDEGASATIVDARFTDVGGRGLNAQRGGVIDATRITADDVRDVVALASSEGEVRVTDLSASGGGRGLRAQTGGDLSATRVRFVDVVEDAVQVSNEGSALVVEDLEVRGGTPGMLPARGGAAFSGSSLTIRRARMSGVVWGGVSVMDPTTTAVIEDVDISDTRAYHDGTAGYGLAVLAGSLEADRVRIDSALTMGIGLGFGARLTIRDVSVSATRSELLTGLWGRAMSAQGPGDQVVVERGVFEESIAAGVFAAGDGTTFDLSDVVVRTTRRRDCSGGLCVEEGGVGLVSYYGASVRVGSFLITDNDVAGAQLGEGGELDLSDGVVSGQPIGVSIQTTGYDVSRLTEEVRYVDNGSNLDTDSLPVPSESASIEPTEEPPED